MALRLSLSWDLDSSSVLRVTFPVMIDESARAIGRRLSQTCSSVRRLG